MLIYRKGLDNMVEIVIYTLVSFHPFFWWYVHLTTAFLILRQVVSFWWWLCFVVNYQHLKSFAKWIMFILLVSLPYSSIHLIFMCFLIPCCSSLVCSSLLHPNPSILYIVAFMYIKYYSSVFFVTLFLNWSSGSYLELRGLYYTDHHMPALHYVLSRASAFQGLLSSWTVFLYTISFFLELQIYNSLQNNCLLPLAI